MPQFLQTEATIRLTCFAVVFAVMAIWESIAPRRKLTIRRPWRWTSNLGLVFLNSLLLRLIAPLGAAGVALAAESKGGGLFNARSKGCCCAERTAATARSSGCAANSTITAIGCGRSSVSTGSNRPTTPASGPCGTPSSGASCRSARRAPRGVASPRRC